MMEENSDMKNKYVMNLHIFENDVNIIDRTGAESLIPVQESNEIIQGIIIQSAVLQRGRKLPNMTCSTAIFDILWLQITGTRQ